jgi:hypothetical protein
VWRCRQGPNFGWEFCLQLNRYRVNSYNLNVRILGTSEIGFIDGEIHLLFLKNPSHSSIQGIKGTVHFRLHQTRRNADRSAAYKITVKNEWSYIYTAHLCINEMHRKNIIDLTLITKPHAFTFLEERCYHIQVKIMYL